MYSPEPFYGVVAESVYLIFPVGLLTQFLPLQLWSFPQSAIFAPHLKAANVSIEPTLLVDSQDLDSSFLRSIRLALLMRSVMKLAFRHEYSAIPVRPLEDASQGISHIL
jgi:hypothetical protein